MPAWWETAAAAVASAAVKEEQARAVKEEQARLPCSAAPAACAVEAIIDVDDFSEDEAVPPAASAAVLKAVDAARTLLTVNTNGNGGAGRFHACTDGLRDLIAAAPGGCRQGTGSGTAGRDGRELRGQVAWLVEAVRRLHRARSGRWR